MTGEGGYRLVCHTCVLLRACMALTLWRALLPAAGVPTGHGRALILVSSSPHTPWAPPPPT